MITYHPRHEAEKKSDGLLNVIANLLSLSAAVINLVIALTKLKG